MTKIAHSIMNLILVIIHVLSIVIDVNLFNDSMDNNFAKIVNGFDAFAGEFRWQIAVLVNGQFNCGGAIINAKTVLTAAHCVTKLRSSNITIYYNSIELNSGGRLAKVSKIIIYPKYNSLLVLNDIAILQLSKRIKLCELNANKICLPSPNSEPIANSVATVSGWGRTQVNGSISRHLLAANVPIISRKRCRYLYRNLLNEDNKTVMITENMICAGGHHRFICAGDSGGPLVYRERRKAVLIGIVSQGFNCGKFNIPDIYTRVSSYVNWIIKNLA